MADRYLITKDAATEGAAVPEQLKLKIERNKGLSEEKTKVAAEKRKEKTQQRHDLKMRTLKYDKEYRNHTKTLVSMRREAKASGNFFVEPEAKLIFVVRIVGIIKLSPKPRKVLQLLRLKQLHNGVFLKINKPILNMLKLINPYVTYGYPSLKNVKELVYKRGFGKVNKPILNMLKYVQPYVTYGYPSLKTIRDLIYKRGFAKVNKQRIPLSDNEIVSTALGKYGIHGVEDMVHELFTVGPNFKQVSNFLWPFKLSSPRGGFVHKRHGFCEQKGGDWGNREELINELIRRMN